MSLQINYKGTNPKVLNLMKDDMRNEKPKRPRTPEEINADKTEQIKKLRSGINPDWLKRKDWFYSQPISEYITKVTNKTIIDEEKYYYYYLDEFETDAYIIESVKGGMFGIGKKEVKDKIKEFLSSGKIVLQVEKSAPADAPVDPADAATAPPAVGGRRSKNQRKSRNQRRSRKQRNQRKSRRSRR